LDDSLFDFVPKSNTKVRTWAINWLTFWLCKSESKYRVNVGHLILIERWLDSPDCLTVDFLTAGTQIPQFFFTFDSNASIYKNNILHYCKKQYLSIVHTPWTIAKIQRFVDSGYWLVVSLILKLAYLGVWFGFGTAIVRNWWLFLSLFLSQPCNSLKDCW
jgi:hypothetical protein